MIIPLQHVTAPNADPYFCADPDLLTALTAAIAPLQALHQQAIEALAPTVQGILHSGSRDVPWIEHTLDQLLNHACMPKGLTLFKALCRHYWQLDPQATASYINAYREMWDGEDKNDTAEMAP